MRRQLADAARAAATPLPAARRRDRPRRADRAARAHRRPRAAGAARGALARERSSSATPCLRPDRPAALVKGFIDALAAWDDELWVVDYKSDVLGAPTSAPRRSAGCASTTPSRRGSTRSPPIGCGGRRHRRPPVRVRAPRRGRAGARRRRHARRVERVARGDPAPGGVVTAPRTRATLRRALRRRARRRVPPPRHRRAHVRPRRRGASTSPEEWSPRTAGSAAWTRSRSACSCSRS